MSHEDKLKELQVAMELLLGMAAGIIELPVGESEADQIGYMLGSRLDYRSLATISDMIEEVQKRRRVILEELLEE